VDQGDEVSTYYDPMLGKIIACGESRAAAIEVLRGALDEIEIVGVATNRALLASVLADDAFRRGAVGTDFLAVRQPHLRFAEPEPAALDIALAAVWCTSRQTLNNALWGDSRGWRLAAPASTTWAFGKSSVVVELSAPNNYVAHVGREEFAMSVIERGAQSLHVECNGQALRVAVIEAAPQLHLFRRGLHVALRAARTEDALQVAAGAEQGSLLTPLPGTVVAVHVAAGQRVARGAPLVTVEAMKMEHTLTAPYDGLVARLVFGLGDRVQAGAVLVELSALKATLEGK